MMEHHDKARRVRITRRELNQAGMQSSWIVTEWLVQGKPLFNCSKHFGTVACPAAIGFEKALPGTLDRTAQFGKVIRTERQNGLGRQVAKGAHSIPQNRQTAMTLR